MDQCTTEPGENAMTRATRRNAAGKIKKRTRTQRQKRDGWSNQRGKGGRTGKTNAVLRGGAERSIKLVECSVLFSSLHTMCAVCARANMTKTCT